MNSSDPNRGPADSIPQVDYIIDAVEKRGYDDIQEEYDDYRILLDTFEFRKLITFELYEAYFPPRRHEFELQILAGLIDVVTANKAAVFLGGAAVGGVVGNAAYDVVRKSLGHIIHRLRTTKRSHDAFREIEETLEAIRAYFQTRDHARTEEVCSALKLEPHKVEPLLKLLGFRCGRRKKHPVWIRPDSW
jgi:hypothetical protein